MAPQDIKPAWPFCFVRCKSEELHDRPARAEGEKRQTRDDEDRPLNAERAAIDGSGHRGIVVAVADLDRVAGAAACLVIVLLGQTGLDLAAVPGRVNETTSV